MKKSQTPSLLSDLLVYTIKLGNIGAFNRLKLISCLFVYVYVIEVLLSTYLRNSPLSLFSLTVYLIYLWWKYHFTCTVSPRFNPKSKTFTEDFKKSLLSIAIIKLFT